MQLSATHGGVCFVHVLPLGVLCFQGCEGDCNSHKYPFLVASNKQWAPSAGVEIIVYYTALDIPIKALESSARTMGPHCRPKLSLKPYPFPSPASWRSPQAAQNVVLNMMGGFEQHGSFFGVHYDECF